MQAVILGMTNDACVQPLYLGKPAIFWPKSLWVKIEGWCRFLRDCWSSVCLVTSKKDCFKAFDWIETTWERLHGVHLQLQWMSIAHMVGISSDCAWQSCFQLEPLVNVHSPCLPGNKFRSWNSQHEPLCFSIRSKLSNGFEIEHFPKVMYNEAKTFFTLKNKISKLQRSPK